MYIYPRNYSTTTSKLGSIYTGIWTESMRPMCRGYHSSNLSRAPISRCIHCNIKGDPPNRAKGSILSACCLCCVIQQMAEYNVVYAKPPMLAQYVLPRQTCLKQSVAPPRLHKTPKIGVCCATAHPSCPACPCRVVSATQCAGWQGYRPSGDTVVPRDDIERNQAQVQTVGSDVNSYTQGRRERARTGEAGLGIVLTKRDAKDSTALLRPGQRHDRMQFRPRGQDGTRSAPYTHIHSLGQRANEGQRHEAYAFPLSGP